MQALLEWPENTAKVRTIGVLKKPERTQDVKHIEQWVQMPNRQEIAARFTDTAAQTSVWTTPPRECKNEHVSRTVNLEFRLLGNTISDPDPLRLQAGLSHQLKTQAALMCYLLLPWELARSWRSRARDPLSSMARYFTYHHNRVGTLIQILRLPRLATITTSARDRPRSHFANLAQPPSPQKSTDISRASSLHVWYCNHFHRFK